MNPNTISRDELIRDYVQLMLSGNAALFAGSGLSAGSYPTWAAMLEDDAKKLGVNLNTLSGYDYYDFANWYCQFNSDRNSLIQKIVTAISKPGTPSVNHRIIARLPISRVWTTNYDTLLEIAYRDQKKKVKVISRDKDFPFSELEEVKVYKMHGCIRSPDDVVITRDDIDNYHRKYEIMSNAFAAALVQDCFLFLGFSFIDLNFKAILGRITSHFNDLSRRHFAVLKRPVKWDEQTTFNYMISDLSRKGIKVCLIEDYDEIPLLLMDIEKAYMRENVFVSGSFNHESPLKGDHSPVYREEKNWSPSKVATTTTEKINEAKKDIRSAYPYVDTYRSMPQLLEQLGERLMQENLTLFTGFGLGVCDKVVEGASRIFVNNDTYQSIVNKIKIFPLSHKNNFEMIHNQFYRENMIGACGFMMIARGGTHASDYTSGTFEEYYIAKGLSTLLTRQQGNIIQQIRTFVTANEGAEVVKDLEKQAQIDDFVKRHAALVYYKHQEVIELFHRLFYEQWKLVIRSLDAGKFRMDQQVLQHFPDHDVAWKRIQRQMEDLVYNRAAFFQKQFTRSYLTRTHNFEDTFAEQFMLQVEQFAIAIEKSENTRQSRYLVTLLHAARKLLFGDYKYLKLHHFIYRLERAERRYQRTRYPMRTVNPKAVDVALRNYEQVYNELITFLYHYYDIRDGKRKEEQPHLQVKRTLSAYLDEGMEQGLQFRDHHCKPDDSAIDDDSFLDCHHRELQKYLQNMPGPEETKHKKYLVCKIQAYKYLYLLCEFPKSLRRLESNQRTAEIRTKDRLESELRKSLKPEEAGTREESEEEVETAPATITTDPLIFDPGEVSQYLALHKKYFNHYMSVQEILRDMIGVKRAIRNMKKGNLAGCLHNMEGFVASIRKTRSDTSLPYRSSPYRAATVVIPVATFGGMARKVWKEEWYRFDYLCGTLNDVDARTVPGEKTERERLLASYNQLSDIDLSCIDDNEMRQRAYRKLLEAVFHIVRRFKQPAQQAW